MKKIFLVAAFSLWSASAFAQAPQTVRICTGTQPTCTQISDTNPLPVSGQLSPFGPTSTGTPISVTTGGVTGTLPAGAVVVATNVGTTNAAYCKLGASATTSDQYISPNGGWFAFTVGAATQLTCRTSSSTTTVNMVGGSGLPSGTGGGGGGSGGAVTMASAAVASGAYSSGSIASGAYASGSIASGAMVDLGAQTDSACATDTGTCSLIALQKKENQNTSASLPAGAAIVGQFGIDQTSDGTTNGVRPTSQYPGGSIPVTHSATGTTSATAATLAAHATKTTYICGFSIRANATAAATNNSTVSGTVTGTLNFTQWTAPLASGIGITEMIFSPCVPGSAANTAIVVTSGAPGSGGVVSVSAWGYQL